MTPLHLEASTELGSLTDKKLAWEPPTSLLCLGDGSWLSFPNYEDRDLREAPCARVDLRPHAQLPPRRVKPPFAHPVPRPFRVLTTPLVKSPRSLMAWSDFTSWMNQMTSVLRDCVDVWRTGF